MNSNSNKKLDSSRDHEGSGSSTSRNWIEKLKPSTKNRLICKKYKNLSSYDYGHELTKYGIHTISVSGENEDIEHSKEIEYSNQQSSKDKNNQEWNKLISATKFQGLQIETNLNEHSRSQIVEEVIEDKLENSFISDNNIEEINNIIEERYKLTLSENMFLRQENHSIIPFLLVNNKEVHRMCLSDYEIKMICKNYKNKSKTSRLEAYDYYRMGLINFYRGKHSTAYYNFKNAYKMKEKDPNLAKWLAFISIVIIFCDRNQLDFEQVKYKKYEEDKITEDNGNEEIMNFFPCCSSRKVNLNRLKTVQMHIGKNDFYINSHDIKDKNEANLHPGVLAKELVDLLKIVISGTYGSSHENANTKNNFNSNLSLANLAGMFKSGNNNNFNSNNIEVNQTISHTQVKPNIVCHDIEGWWLFIFIGIFTTLHSKQTYFNLCNVYDPKYCIKKIKERDPYLAYMAYADYHFYTNDNFSIDKLLKQLISKYSNKVEAYLRYWQLLIKGRYKNYELANSISEIYWKNCSTISFDDNIY